MKISQWILEKVRKSGITLVTLSLIVLAILILYWQDLSFLVNEALQSEAMNHIILVPFLACFLIYRRRELSRASLGIDELKRKRSLVSFGEITGIAVCLSAFLLYWYGSYTTYPTNLSIHVASLILLLTGITLTLSNVKTLTTLILPILFLIFLAPPPSIITDNLGGMLGYFDAQASCTLLKALGMPVTLSLAYGGPIITFNTSTSSTQFTVAQACSGIYSLIAFAMFVAFLVLVVGGPIAKKIAIIPIGFLMLPIINVTRISLIVIIAYKISEDIAMNIFHTFSGWLFLSVGMLILLLIAEKILHLKIYETPSKPAACNACRDASQNDDTFCPDCGKFLGNHQAKIDKKFWIKLTGLLLITAVVVLTIQAPVFAFSQKLTLTNADPSTTIDAFPNATNYRLNFLYRDTSYERISGSDASFYYAYFPQNTSSPTIFVLVGVAGAMNNLHNWEACLVSVRTGQGLAPAVNVLDQRDTQIMGNPPIVAQYLTFTYPSDYAGYANYTQVTLYWYQRCMFKTGPTIQPKYVRISLLILTRNPSDYPKLEQTLLSMGQAITAYWEPLKSQTLISIGIPAMQALLASTIVFAAFMQTTQYANDHRKRATNLQLFERYGSPDEKRLYQTIKDLRQKTKETTKKNIESAIKEEPANSVKASNLQDTLRNLQENGIIQLDVINIQNQPRLVWKP